MTRYLGLVGLAGPRAREHRRGGGRAGLRPRETRDRRAVALDRPSHRGKSSRCTPGLAACLGLAAGVLGILLCLPLAAVLPTLIGDLLPVEIGVRVTPAAIATGLGLSVWATLLCAIGPVLDLAKVAPLRALRRDFLGRACGGAVRTLGRGAAHRRKSRPGFGLAGRRCPTRDRLRGRAAGDRRRVESGRDGADARAARPSAAPRGLHVAAGHRESLPAPEPHAADDDRDRVRALRRGHDSRRPAKRAGSAGDRCESRSPEFRSLRRAARPARARRKPPRGARRGAGGSGAAHLGAAGRRRRAKSSRVVGGRRSLEVDALGTCNASIGSRTRTSCAIPKN